MTDAILTKSEKLNLNIRYIAQKVREQLKEEFPSFKFSVTIDRYSMGQSLDINLMSGPIFAQSPDRKPTVAGQAVLERAKAIALQYNFDESDSMTDYSNTNFFLHVGIGKFPKMYEKKDTKNLAKPKINEALVAPAFPDAAQDIAKEICPACKKALGKFRNEISKKEYLISGLCQACQDSVFGKD